MPPTAAAAAKNLNIVMGKFLRLDREMPASSRDQRVLGE